MDESTSRVATYRWQLTPSEPFAAAAAAAPDLAALGVSHLYLSPVAEAVPGSTHGYDVTDPTRLREELGGEDGFADLVASCRTHGLRLLIDIVPNHLAAHETNPSWWDVLRMGRASRCASVFDVDWDAGDRLLLPVLGDHYGRELEAGHLRLARGLGPAGLLVICYHDRTFPLPPRTEGAILVQVARRVGDDVLAVAGRVLARAEAPDGTAADQRADLEVAGRIILERLTDPAVATALHEELVAISDDPDRLDAVLATAHHRLARWSVGDAEGEYRRFFDVDALVATAMEGGRAFDLLHRLPARLLDLDVVDGIRIDHIDGLADPARYLQDVRAIAGPSSWVLVEKILRPGEALPSWPVEGTTGYEVADLLGGWLTDPAGAATLTEGWRSRTGEHRTFTEVAEEARREVLATRLATDLERVTTALAHVCAHRRRHRDHARRALRDAVGEVAIHLDRYRTYVRPDDGPSAADRAAIHTARQGAGGADPSIDPELLDLIEALLTGRYDGAAEDQFRLRFQQLTGPLAAKGEEDTALYRYLPLPHRCEVGADPGRPTWSAEDWHQACAAAQDEWPERMTTLSTHDTKRSADSRARLAALTARPHEVLDAFDEWWGAVDPGPVDPATGWLVFHALAAAWPLSFERAHAAVEKSIREAGVRTSWIQPDPTLEEVVRSVLERTLAPGPTRSILERLVAAVAVDGDRAALAQLAAQLLAPGVPDLYQGAEGWDRTLVDPDNRQPIDPARRAELVRAAATDDPVSAWDDAHQRADGLPRAILLHRILGARRRHPEAVGPGRAGTYLPLTAEGADAQRVLAFGRGEPTALVVVVVGPLGGRIPDATVQLPPGRWNDLLSGATRTGAVELGPPLDTFPVLLLESDAA